MNRQLTALTLVMLLFATPTVSAITHTSGVHYSHDEPTPPPDGPDHGINETDWYQLWSEDIDDGDPDSLDDDASDEEIIQERIHSGDATFDTPTALPEQWNKGDINDFNPGGASTSVHPENTDLKNGQTIKDAYIRLFAVQPSTIVHTTEEKSTHFIAPSGDTYSTIDYRVDLPEDDTRGDYQVYHSVAESEVSTVRLTANNQIEDTAFGTNTPQLEYTDLSGQQTLEVEADISVTVKKTIKRISEDCPDDSDDKDDCTETVETSTSTSEHSLTVTDTVETSVYDIAASGNEITQTTRQGKQYGTDISTTNSWSEIRLPGDNNDVDGAWGFYVQGNQDYTKLVESTSNGDTKVVSSARPTQLHAFPSTTSLQSNPHSYITVLQSDGDYTRTPDLPDYINVGAQTGYYQDYDRLVTNIDFNDEIPNGNVEVIGLVRGVTATPELEQKKIRESKVNTTVISDTGDELKVHVSVSESETANPVTTGTIVVNDNESSLNETGEATVTVPYSQTIQAEHIPLNWWETNTPYTGDTQHSTTPLNLPSFGRVVDLLVATVFWLLMGYMILASYTMIHHHRLPFRDGDHE